MRAWIVGDPGPLSTGPLTLSTKERPRPYAHEVLVEVSVCGVCRTDLHVVEGDLPVHRAGVVPGHEIVGVVAAIGPDVRRFSVGDRIGIAWLRSTCGECRFCERGDENLCLSPRFTGWDADGGYAEYAVVHEDYAYGLPEAFDDVHAAPLLCAGIIGYRALKRAELPPAGRLGIYGFGGSAHLAAQVAIHQGARVHVMTRGEEARSLARRLGAASVHDAYGAPPEPLDSAILFAPVGELVPVALAALDRGGTLAIAGIHLTDVPPLNYQDHLFQERRIVSVTANTRSDGLEFLEVAARIPIEVSATPYPFERVGEALLDLSEGRVRGAAVIRVGGRGR